VGQKAYATPTTKAKKDEEVMNQAYLMRNSYTVSTEEQ
jgi:hypothetical protein